MKEFALYVDDSGSPKPNPKDATPYFAMGGVLIERGDEEQIENEVRAFKEEWKIPLEVALHGAKIRAKRDSFAWLATLGEEELNRFHSELGQMITRCPIIVHACVISRAGYCTRYLAQYGTSTWEMMKTALSILLERTAKFVARQDGTVMVYFERIGKVEDRLIQSYFFDLRSNGLPFNPSTSNKYNPMPSSELASRLSGIEGKTKKNVALQVADLCLYPVAHAKKRPDNRAYVTMRGARKIVDQHLAEHQNSSEGIKYSCFD